MLQDSFPPYSLRLGKHSKITFFDESKVEKNVDLIEQFKVTDGSWAIYHFPYDKVWQSSEELRGESLIFL